MKTAIIGGESVGLLFAYYFSRGGSEVTVYTRRKEQAQMLNRSGLRLKGTRESVNLYADVLQHTKKIEEDLVIVAVKQYHLQNIADSIHHCVDEHTKMLFLQNGMGHVNFIKKLRHPHIFVGVVEHGVLKTSDFEIELIGKGKTKIAAFQGDLKSLSRNLGAHQSFLIEYQDDWYPLLAEKLLVNAVINPLTALYRVENGALHSSSYFQKNMTRLFEETFAVLDLDDKETHWQRILNVCHNTAKNRSSMLRDIELRRPTEIDAISGYILRQAEIKNIELPYTSFVYESIKGMSG